MVKKYISQEEKELRARINDLENKKLEIARQLSSYTSALQEQRERAQQREREAVRGKCFLYHDVRWRVTTHKETNRTKTWIMVLSDGDKDYCMHCLVVSESIIEEKDVSLFAMIYENAGKEEGSVPMRIIDSCQEVSREEFLREYEAVSKSFEALLPDRQAAKP